MSWNNNDKSCVSVWYYLAATKQLTTDFESSPKVKMADLKLWDELSPEITKAKAEAWAEWYVSYITAKDGAKYETGYNWAKTVAAMVKVMTDETKTVEDLSATVNDAIYFYAEVKP